MKISTVIIRFTVVLFTAAGFEIRGDSRPTNRRPARVASGQQFDRELYPYVVGLRGEIPAEETFFCTGSLVTPLFVLTAAHCAPEASTVEVYQNDPRNASNEKRTVVKFFKHSLFNETSMVADICLLKIHRPFENIYSYPVISGYPKHLENRDLLTCHVLGWGKDGYDYPKYKAKVATVRVKYGPDACEVPPDNAYVSYIVKLTWKEFLCAVPDDRMVCVGDSGGPLICHGFLFGIASHGYNYFPGMVNANTGCGDSRVQTRHVYVHKYRKWIDDVIVMHGMSGAVRCNNRLYVLFGLIVWLFLPVTKVQNM